MTSWAKGLVLALVGCAWLGASPVLAQTPPPPSFEIGDAPLVSPGAALTYFQSEGLTTTDHVSDPLITRTAHALGDDPDRIYAFVHNEIDVIPLFGVQKGARGALIDKVGTPFDVAHLMGELLYAAGVSSQYVLGTITLDRTQFRDWFGVENTNAATEMLADGGIPATVSGDANGYITQVVMMHMWVRVTIGGTQYLFDPAYKTHTARSGSLTAAGLDSAMGFSASSFITGQALSGATSSSTSTPHVSNVSHTNVQSAMQTYSSNLLTNIRANFANAETADVIGGTDIVAYEGAPLRQTSISNLAESSSFANNVPYALRTQVAITVYTQPSPLHYYYRLDEIYAQEIAVIPDPEFPQPPAPDTYGFYVNGQRQPAEAPLVLQGAEGSLDISFDHPYAANGGAYLDRTFNKGFDFHGGATQFILGAGRITPDFGAYLEAHSSGDEGYIDLNYTTQASDEQQHQIIGSRRATKRRFAASFATQLGSAMDVLSHIGRSSVLLHDLVVTSRDIPMWGYPAISATVSALSVQGAFTANANSGSAADTLAVRRATAAVAATLESSAVQQNTDAVNAVSTASRFDWSSNTAHSAGSRTFYLVRPGDTPARNYLISQLLNDYEGQSTARSLAEGYLDNGYTIIVPGSSDLGPGDESTVAVCRGSVQNPVQCVYHAPERGSAIVALSPTGIAHMITVTDGAALKGGAGNDDAEANPDRVFSIPDDFLERQFTSRAEAYNVDLGTGTLNYTPPPDLVVGEGAYPYSLSFQRSFHSGDPVEGPPPPPGGRIFVPIKGEERLAGGWTSNFTAVARVSNEGQRTFGEQSPREATDTIAALRVVLALSGDQANDLTLLQYQLGAMHALAWWQEQLSYNAVEIQHGGDHRSFVRLADGTFSGPPGDATQVELFGQRTLFAPQFEATRRWWYRGMCVRATASDGSISYYGPWNAGYASCNTSDPGENPRRGQQLMQFRHQTFAQGDVTVDFDGTTLSNSLGRSITMTTVSGSRPNLEYTVSDGEQTARNVGIGLDTSTGRGGMTVRGTDNNTWTYDGANPVNWRVFAPSSATTPIVTFNFAPGAHGQVYTLTDAANHTAQYWISSGRVAAMVDPLGHASRTYFDAHGQPARVIDRLGNETRTRYDAFRRVARVTHPEGDYEEYEYNPWHARTHVRRVAKPGSGLADINTYTTYATTQANFFATCGMPATETDANGNVTAYALVANRCLVQTMTQPAVDDGTNSAATLVNPVTTYTWNAHGQRLTRTDPTGRVTTNAYNATTNYLSSVTAPGGALTQFGRDTVGNITSVTDPRNYVHHGTYDASRRLTRYDGPTGTNAASEWHYDMDGLVDYTRQATGLASPNDWATTNYTYWPTGRVKTMTDPENHVTQYFYDELNRPSYTLDPVNRRSESHYDAESHVTEELRGVGSPHQITYATRAWTANGQLDWVEDAEGNRSDMVYDGFDRLCRLFFPVTALNDHHANAPAGPLACNTAANRSTHDYEEYAYDANGNRLSVRLRSEDATHNDIIAYGYDALNREMLRDLPGTASDVTTRYDLAGRKLYARFSTSLTYDTACNTSFTGVDYCYDTAGRVSAETSYGRRLQFGYDLSSNRTSLTYADGMVANTTYDPLNRVDQIGENGVFTGAQLLADYAYDAQSRRTSLARGNGTATTYGYSPASRLTSLNHDLSGTTNDANWAYTYTAAGQLETRTLVSVYEWTVPALNQAYTRNGLNQYTNVAGTTYTNDRRGNLTGDGARTLTYDLENHLTSVVEGGATKTLNYDPLGRLRSLVTSTQTTEFLYDGDRLVAEYDPNRSAGNQLLRRYVHGEGVDEPLVWYECPSPTPGACTSNRNWLIADRQGSIIATTDGGGGATIYRYGPYGEPEGGVWTGSRFRYTGQIALPELRLYHYKARVYDPGLGRFLQTDPVGYEDDIDLYAYVGNDPLNRGDPTGQFHDCTAQGCHIDSEIRQGAAPLDDGLAGDPNQQTTTVTFVNDDPNGASPDQPIAQEAAVVFENAVRDSGISSINVNSTTGGVHASNSLHYDDGSGGHAVDYNRVNGEPVGIPDGTFHEDHTPHFNPNPNNIAAVTSLENAAAAQPGVGEVFGPASNTTFIHGPPHSPGGTVVQHHENHGHIGTSRPRSHP